MDAQQNQAKNTLFRQSAIDRISSPEELDQYLKVTGPGVWFPLLTIIVLLIGVFVWMFLGSVSITMDVPVEAREDGIICYVPIAHRESALKSGIVTIADREYPLADAGFAPLQVNESFDADLQRIGALESGTLIMPLLVDGQLINGVYTGAITVETVHPIRFIVN